MYSTRALCGSLAVLAASLCHAPAAVLDPNGVPVPMAVAATAPFHDFSLIEDLAGYWSGQGSALYTDGSLEKLNCVAIYSLQGPHDGTIVRPGEMQQSIRCKGTSMDLKLGGSWVVRDGAIAGTWSEDTYSLSGQLTGKAVAAGFDLKATSSLADASVAVRLSGCSQDIEMSFTQEIDKLHLVLRKC